MNSDDKTSKIPRFWIGLRKDWEAGDDLARAFIALPAEKLRTHAYVLGATGCGKTTCLNHLLYQDIASGHSLVLLDMRGDLVESTLRICALCADPSRVRIVDLREAGRCFGFNPLVGSGESYFRALGVLDVIAAEAQSWGVQLSETLRNALMALAEVGERLTNLENFFYRQDFRQHCIGHCETEHVRGFWERFELMSEEKRAAMASPVLNKVSALFATRTLRNLLGHANPFDLKAHLDRKGSVTLVSLAVDETHASGRMLGSLILSSICREVFSRVHVPEERRNPVRVVVDEFENFGMPDFEAILAEGRRFKLHAVLAHQTLAQLSPKMRSLILGNVGTKLVFRTGRDDAATLSRDIFGDTSFDFTKLPTGEAILWSRNAEIVHVETNEPLNIACPTERLNSYLDQVYAAAQPMGDRGAYSGTVPAPEQRRNNVDPDLGDWLCD